MIVEYIRYNIPVDRGDEFSAAYAQADKILDTDPHCLGYEISRGVEEPQHWIVRIEWASIEGHEHGFRGAAHFRDFFAAVRPFFDNIDEMKHYQIHPSSQQT